MEEELRKVRRPEWVELFETFKSYDYEEIITYEELDAKLIDGSVKNTKKYVFSKFRIEMLRQESKALENIPNRGYRIVPPNEHIRLSNNKLKQAERRARNGADIILHVNYNMLNEEERAKANLYASRVQNVVAGLIGENKALKQLTVNFKQPEIPRK